MELVTLLVVLCSGQIVGASLRSECQSVHNGIYFNNNCYVYTHIRRNWGDTMTYWSAFYNKHHHYDPYEHYNSALMMIYSTNGASGQLQLRRSGSPVNGFHYYAVCQINDHIRNFERFGKNLRVVRPPVLRKEMVETLAKCAKLCGQQPLCLGFNYADSPSMVNSTNCEALTWLMVDAGPNYAQYDNGWSYYERVK